MKKRTFSVVLCIAMVLLTVNSLLFVLDGYGASEEIDSKFGESPVIDGYIDLQSDEWDEATKKEIFLEDLPIKCWVIQNDENLYISLQIELESGYHNITEFIGLIISNSSSENKENFKDAKIIQFSNISANQFTYFDYYINNSVFSIDNENNGNGVAKMEGHTSVYEFSIPIKNDTNSGEDVALNFGDSYAFNITYGDTTSYPNGIKKSTIVLINLESVPSSLPTLSNVFLYASCIVIFSVLGILYGFYIYKLFKLKEKIQRIKR
ncbi:MAG: hypothetical protein ACFFDY_02920 [Candidatus Thorarchaeota archaeon]